MATILADAKSERSGREAKIKLLESEIKKAQSRIDILYDDRLNGAISFDDFKRLSVKANADCEYMKEQMSNLKESPKAIQGKKSKRML